MFYMCVQFIHVSDCAHRAEEVGNRTKTESHKAKHRAEEKADEGKIKGSKKVHDVQVGGVVVMLPFGCCGCSL